MRARGADRGADRLPSCVRRFRTLFDAHHPREIGTANADCAAEVPGDHDDLALEAAAVAFRRDSLLAVDAANRDQLDKIADLTD